MSAWSDRARLILADIDAGEDERRRNHAADDRYQPPQFGSIDSSAYLLNLKACLGQCVPHLLAELDEANRRLDVAREWRENRAG